MAATTHLGAPVNRVDGHAKVTGRARYAAEYPAADLAHGWVVSSTIAAGRIARIDTAEALALPGVLQVFTHDNRPPLAEDDDSWRDEVAPPGGSPFRPLHDAQIRFSAQPAFCVRTLRRLGCEDLPLPCLQLLSYLHRHRL